MILFNLAIAAAHFIERTFVVRGKYNINKEKIKWEVQGNTKNGKVITAAFKNHVVHIPVENDGDYIEVTPVNIYVITDGKEKISLSDILEY